MRAEAAVYDFHNANLRGQEVLGQAADVLDAWKEKRLLAIVKYRRSCKALLVLRGAGPWIQELRELHEKDMSTMYGAVLDTQEKAAQAESSVMRKCKRHQVDTTSEQPREVSWIWLLEGSLGECNEMSSLEDVRVHWVRSQARMKWWEEEQELLWEEQCRVLVTLGW
ncbi:uncharacterized protein ARMOST_15519 [Armillaria ostoyae]|uniref:Uncharacterized protein n=1 Tax=Armillaria ostoyae TaxID=47428 RepID=A0A284RTK9_ARMOS|nr:uncharacterized protein ARMOST_15519 [Armillaria ostoyae]